MLVPYAECGEANLESIGYQLISSQNVHFWTCVMKTYFGHMYTNAHSLHGIYDNGLSGIGLNSTIGYGGLDGNEALTASYLYIQSYSM